MQQDEIISYWGRDNLKRWSEESLHDVMIPTSSKAFLKNVGLPFQVNWTLNFALEADKLPRLSHKSHYRRICFDDVVPICLDEHNGGKVVAVEQEIGGLERPINRDVTCFGECLIYYQQYRTSVRNLAEDKVGQIITTTEERIRKADPTAFENPNNWWPLILEQMNQGLL